jgi:signal peptidase I
VIDPQEAVKTEAPADLPTLPPVASSGEAGEAVRPHAVRGNGLFDLKSLLSIAVIVVFVITFVVQAFRVPSPSMENTLLVGDFLLADKLHFADAGGAWGRVLPYREIQRGDVVVFRYPIEPSVYFVKRVVAVPGDHIHLRNKVVYVNGQPVQEDYVVHRRPDSDSYRDNFPTGDDPRGSDCPWCSRLARFVRDGELEVPAGSYFVMGDNRDQSSDSRYWGFVPRDNIMGRPLVIYLSVRGLREDRINGSGDKLFPSGQMLAHFFQLTRWERMFRVVR